MDSFKVESTVWAMDPRWITVKICLQSPENRTVNPPKGLEQSLKSWSDLSSASNANLCSIDSLSMTMKSARHIKLPFTSRGDMLHVDSSVTCKGTLNLLWKVLPFRRRFAAMSDIAVSIAIFPDLTTLNEILITWVFPVPPLASRASNIPRLLLTESRTVSNTCFCSKFRDNTYFQHLPSYFLDQKLIHLGLFLELQIFFVYQGCECVQETFRVLLTLKSSYRKQFALSFWLRRVMN